MATLARRIKNRILGPSDHQCLEHLSPTKRRQMWPPVIELQTKHIQNCKMVMNRDVLLDLMPKNGICAEVGIFKCEYSAQILQKLTPKKLHLIDLNPGAIDIAKSQFPTEIENGVVETHLGDSSARILEMPDGYFDWVYIDGDHYYDGVKKDLEATLPKIKPDGLIQMNDYIFFETSGFTKYGVIEAVNEFCVTHNFEMIYFAFQGRMYNDVVLRRIGV